MLIDLIWTASPALLVVVTAAYATALMWLLAVDVEYLRWRQEFSGWRAIQHDRVLARFAPSPMLLGLGYFARRRWQRTYGCGWRSVQRHRIARRCSTAR